MSHRIIVHASYYFSADFLLYKDHGREVLVVHGTDLPVDGEVDEATFRALLKDIRTREKARCRVRYTEKKATTCEAKFDPSDDHYSATRGAMPIGIKEVEQAWKKMDTSKYVMTRSEWEYTYWAQ